MCGEAPRIRFVILNACKSTLKALARGLLPGRSHVFLCEQDYPALSHMPKKGDTSCTAYGAC